MVTQLTLVGEVKRRTLKAVHPQTSFDALRSVPAAKERARILSLIARFGDYGLTADEAEAMRGVNRGHQRFAELRRLNLIRWNGKTRPTRAGRQARVYVIAQ